MAVGLGRCNYDTLSPKNSSNATFMNQGSADEAVVVIKQLADEGMVTCLRIKLAVSNRRLRRRAEHENDGMYFIAIYRHEISSNEQATGYAVDIN